MSLDLLCDGIHEGCDHLVHLLLFLSTLGSSGCVCSGSLLDLVLDHSNISVDLSQPDFNYTEESTEGQ